MNKLFLSSACIVLSMTMVLSCQKTSSSTPVPTIDTPSVSIARYSHQIGGTYIFSGVEFDYRKFSVGPPKIDTLNISSTYTFQFLNDSTIVDQNGEPYVCYRYDYYAQLMGYTCNMPTPYNGHYHDTVTYNFSTHAIDLSVSHVDDFGSLVMRLKKQI